MKNLILIVLLFNLVFSCAFCQDTIKVGKTYYYSKEQVTKLSGKGFIGNYGEEHIVFNNRHTKVEYCFYEDSIRNFYGFNFKIINDSILTISDGLDEEIYETWTFKKLQSNLFSVYREKDGFMESGIVDTLIPLRQLNAFVMTSKDEKDTLWQTNHFTVTNLSFGYYYSDFNVSTVDGKVYQYDEVDSPPFQLNNDSLPALEIKDIHYCICDPFKQISTVTCIITKEGKIINIEEAFGNLGDHCSYTLMEINKAIYRWGKVKPAMVNGKSVNVRWFITINDLSNPNLHPAFEDTDKKRRKFIKNKTVR